MTDLPEISVETVRTYRRAAITCAVLHGDTPHFNDCCVRAGLAAALVASGWRREGDVLREAYWKLRDHAEAYRSGELSRGVQERFRADPDNAVLGRAASRDRWYAGGIDAAARDIAELMGVPEHEIEREVALEPVLVPCECPDPRCTNRIAVLLVGDDDPAEVADVVAAFEMGEKGVTKPPAGTPRCTCPLIDVSSTLGQLEFVLGDPAGCKVHGRKRDAEIEAAKRRARG